MNIVFFTEIAPFPINRGERIRSYGLLKALSELGHNIHAIINNENQLSLEEYRIENVTFYTSIPKTVSKIDHFLGIPYFVKNNSVIEIFNDVIKRHQIDLAILDYAFLGQYIGYFKRRSIPVIYGTHNAQSNLTLQKPVKGLTKKLIKKTKVFYQSLHERLYFKNADAVIVVSQEDKVYHSSFVPNHKLFLIHNFLDECRYDEHYLKEDYYVMTGNFSAYMNVKGLEWFISKVWNHELDTTKRFFVIGQRSQEALIQIEDKIKYKNVKAIGAVKNMNPFIGKAKAVIVPLLQGSGSRLKCLEAMALKTPIISTPKGVEGIRSEHFIVCSTPEQFRNALLNSNFDTKKGELLNNDFLTFYSLKSILPILEDVINKITEN